MKVTATMVKKALAKSYEGKPVYFMTECKTCSTLFPNAQGLLIFDGLAITKSYSKPNIVGYEIKVSRADFLGDNKWHLYLQYCNEFYFVVPKGLVQKNELPDNVGLIYYDVEKDSLRTVKKAMHRTIDKPVDMYEYIIFSRLEQDRLPFYNSRLDYCKDYLEDKKNKQYVGEMLGTKLANDVQSLAMRLHSVQHKESNLLVWEDIKHYLRTHCLMGYRDEDSAERIIRNLDNALQGGIGRDKVKAAINNLEYSLNSLKSLLEESERNTATEGGDI